MQKLDNLDKNVAKAIDEGLDEVGTDIVQGAQSVVHVISGDLRDSIRVLDKGQNYIVVGSDLDYAVDEELGNAKRPPHPYLLPQADRMQSEASRIIQEKIDNNIL